MSLVVLLLIIVCGLPFLKAQDVKVLCRSTVSCNGGDEIGLMSARECCVENPNGLAYRHTNNSCNPCIVFGFFHEVFIGVEGSDHVVKVGFQKGAAEVGHNLNFHVNDTAGTARKGASLDYSVKSGRVKAVFRKPDPRNVKFSLYTDGIAQEPDENFTLELISKSVLPSVGAVFFRNILNVTIKDNDILSVTFEREVYTVVENEGSVEVCFLTNTGHTERVEVLIELISVTKGIGHSMADINNAPQMVFFEASDSKHRLCVTFEVYDDLIDENDEEFLVKFTNLPNDHCVLGAIPQAYITIKDDDVPTFSIIPMAVTVFESARGVEICITTNSSLAREIEITAKTGLKVGSRNPAKANIDYEKTAVTLTFLPSDEPQVVCDAVRIIDDAIGNEPEEEFSVTLISASPEGSFGDNESCITIIDDDKFTISFEREGYSVGESDGNARVCVVTSIGHAESVDVVVMSVEKAAAANPASRNTDFRENTQTVIFPANATGNILCVDIGIIDDSLDEYDEQFLVQFSNIPNAQAGLGAIPEACVTIVDDDVPRFNIGPPEKNVSESDGRCRICITTNSPLGRNVMVIARTGPKSGAENQATADADYGSTEIVVTFRPSDDGSTQELCGYVSIIDDMIGNEPDEEFSVTLVSASPDGDFGDSESCITITDNDVPEIKWVDPDVTIPEGDDGRVCFSSSSGSVAPYEVVVGVRGKSSRPAVDPEDYTIGTPLTFTIPASNAGDQFCLDISTIDDTKVEGTEQFELYFENLPSSSAALGSPETVCVSIVDDDQLTVSFERETYSAGESDGNAQVCVVTSTGHADSVDVVVMSVEKPTATNPASGNTDFRVSTQTITFPANVTGNTLCVDIGIIGDSLDEYDEQFLVQFGNIPNAQAGLGAIPEACVTIVDDDVPRFNIGPPEKNVSESDGRCRICITTNSPLSRNVMVIARTGPKSGAENQATADADYGSTEIVVTFRPSDDGSTQELCGYVPIIDDYIGNEPDEEFSVTLVSASPYGDFGDSESCITITDNDVVGIEFSTMDVTVNENNGTVTVCLMKNITTDGPITVILDAEEETGVPNAASDASDFRPGFGKVIFAPNQTEACGMVEIKNDDDPETPEVFMVTFEASNLVIPRPPDRQPPIAEVTIIDDDRPPSDFLTCRINEFMQVQPFTRTSEYRFMGVCEHIAVSPCEPIEGFDVRVTVDFLTESLENGAVGLHVNEFRYVSREDGSFDDGGQTPVSSTSTSREYEATPPIRVSVSFGEGMTNITFDSNTDATDPLDTDIEIVHIYGGNNPSIQISIRTPNMSGISDFCGLCGSRLGSLLRRDGSVANEADMTEVQNFAQSYLVEPRDQILRPQRRECGTIRNDTVIGNPLYAVPVYSEELKEKYSLCYEVFGRANSTLNFVSDTCVNVNARYGPMDNPEDGNIIRSVGIRARGLSANSCHNIRVDLEGCSATVETPSGDSQSLASMERFEQDGISVRKYPRRVRISAPNCENVMLVMWVVCETRNDQDMIRFVIARGVNLRASSHGLLGQFWNIPVSFSKYNGTDLPAGTDLSRTYVVTVEPPSPSPARSFLGHLYHLKWDKTREDCVYVGSAQGGPSFEVLDPNDSLIQGRYRDYILPSGDLFETSYTYSRFEEGRCS